MQWVLENRLSFFRSWFEQNESNGNKLFNLKLEALATMSEYYRTNYWNVNFPWENKNFKLSSDENIQKFDFSFLKIVQKPT